MPRAVVLTHSVGRTASETAESGLPPREAGQFEQYASCGVRSAGAHRVQLAASGLTPERGAVVIFCDPDSATPGDTRPLFDWALDADNHITGRYRGTPSEAFQLLRRASGTLRVAEVPCDFAANEALAVYFGWDALGVEVAFNGGDILRDTTTPAIPASLPATFDVGRDIGGSFYLDAGYGAVVLLDGPISAAQWRALASLRTLRPPLYGEVVSERMTGLWYGAGTRLLSAADAIDLTRDGCHLNGIAGGGIPPVEDRLVTPPIRDGAVYAGTRLEARPLRTQLTLHGASPAAFGDARRRIVRALNPRRGVGILTRSAGARLYEIDAVINGGLGFATGPGTVAVETAEWICPGSTWRDVVDETAAGDIPAGGWSLPWTVPWSLAESAVSIHVENAGDVEAWPQIAITAGASGLTSPSLVNVTTGKTFTLSGLALLPGERVTVDMDARTARRDDGTSVMGYRLAASEMWALAPGENEIKLSAAVGGGSAAVTYALSYVGV